MESLFPAHLEVDVEAAENSGLLVRGHAYVSAILIGIPVGC